MYVYLEKGALSSYRARQLHPRAIKLLPDCPGELLCLKQQYESTTREGGLGTYLRAATTSTLFHAHTVVLRLLLLLLLRERERERARARSKREPRMEACHTRQDLKTKLTSPVRLYNKS